MVDWMDWAGVKIVLQRGGVGYSWSEGGLGWHGLVGTIPHISAY